MPTYTITITPKQIFQSALRKLNAIGSGHAFQASELEDCLIAFNAMMDSWNTEKLTIFAKRFESLTLTTAQQSRTIGATGNLVVPRPQTVEQGEAFVTGGSLGTTENELDVLNQQEWAALVKSTSGIPSAIHYNPTMPNGTLYFDPTPDAAYTLKLYTWQLLTQILIGEVDTAMSLAPGYSEALIYNLAVRMAPEYEKEPSLAIAAVAIQSKAQIKRMNQTPMYLAIDPLLLGDGVFDIETGTVR